jgi:ParB-like chromosome segregation protein Spo0J
VANDDVEDGENWPGAPRQRSVKISEISVGDARRRMKSNEVADISQSMRKLGLQSPITVRKMSDGEGHRLIAGHHRLEAAKQLGWGEIDCTVVDWDERQARLWEIAENLHRAKLTALEYHEHLNEWVELTRNARDFGQHVQKLPGRPQSGNAKAARELPLEGKSEEALRKSIERAAKIAAISPEAKAAAKERGLDDNQRALLIIAKESRENQVRMVTTLSSRKRESPSKAKAASISQDMTEQVKASPHLAGDRTSIETLKHKWQEASDLRGAWEAASVEVRDQFCREVLNMDLDASWENTSAE